MKNNKIKGAKNNVGLFTKDYRLSDAGSNNDKNNVEMEEKKQKQQKKDNIITRSTTSKLSSRTTNGYNGYNKHYNHNNNHKSNYSIHDIYNKDKDIEMRDRPQFIDLTDDTANNSFDTPRTQKLTVFL
ncbi:hypothetical protein RFI_11882 [Reticulomyxa filosa]|uniref:Uncharacterized protein n=1 Tax=Reticulomyxa filosa TaxID=46433 RepID=X6NIT0_RETFI|nr:hypothetical protein RFI_11882 [Reticulomyxa filosa]|eukprot:ETO25257.1 hypothetical protein RFI_11882 [Reticulomyxa filosa]